MSRPRPTDRPTGRTTRTVGGDRNQRRRLTTVIVHGRKTFCFVHHNTSSHHPHRTQISQPIGETTGSTKTRAKSTYVGLRLYSRLQPVSTAHHHANSNSVPTGSLDHWITGTLQRRCINPCSHTPRAPTEDRPNTRPPNVPAQTQPFEGRVFADQSTQSTASDRSKRPVVYTHRSRTHSAQ